MNIFISYHHQESDHLRYELEMLADKADHISTSVKLGEIDPNEKEDFVKGLIANNHILDSDVIVVVLSKSAWSRKYIDWEVFSGLSNNIPVFAVLPPEESKKKPGLDFGIGQTRKELIPPRLMDNLENDAAYLFPWPRSSRELYLFIKTATEGFFPERVKNHREIYKIDIPLKFTVVDVETLAMSYEDTSWPAVESLTGTFPLNDPGDYQRDHIPMGKLLSRPNLQIYASQAKQLAIQYMSYPSPSNVKACRKEQLELWNRLISSQEQ